MRVDSHSVTPSWMWEEGLQVLGGEYIKDSSLLVECTSVHNVHVRIPIAQETCGVCVCVCVCVCRC